MSRLASCALACLLLGCDGFQVDLERMIDQHKLEAYEPSPYFEDGTGMRQPPKGTVPYRAPASTDPKVSGLSGDAYLDAIPVEITLAKLMHGKNRFDIYCATCHGALGDGRSQVAENMRLRKPPSLHEPRIVALPVGQVYRVIRDGYGLMPDYAEALSVEDRWQVVAYVQALQLSQNVKLGALPPDIQLQARAWLKQQ